MNKEEMPVFSWNTETKEFYVLGHKFDGVNSIEDFINHITDLDKENKILKENAEHNDKVVDKVNWENRLLKQQNKKYKEVIDKLNDLLSDEFLEVIDRDILLDILKEVE